MDGDKAPDIIKSNFNLGFKELRYSKEEKAIVFDFVGFLFNENDTLVVFPKHFMKIADVERLNSINQADTADISLLRKVIFKYDLTRKSSTKALRYIGEKEGYESNFPFTYFYAIYDYFSRNGLYRERHKKISSKSGSRISWKCTLNRAEKIISDGNIVFNPLYYEKKNTESVFVTDCMAFAIDYTLHRFSSFLNLRTTGYKYTKFDYLGKSKFVIQQLILKKERTFKDQEKRLLGNLIEFYRHINNVGEGGITRIEIKYFNNIWQNMVGQFLNRHFVAMSPKGDKALFDMSKKVSAIRFNDARYSDIDLSPHNFYIDVDHVGLDKETLYLFDSKYYSSVNELNYKQYSYNMILKNRFPNVKNLYSVLFLPGGNYSDIHFQLSPSYTNGVTLGATIIEQYIDPKMIMEDYLLN